MEQALTRPYPMAHLQWPSCNILCSHIEKCTQLVANTNVNDFYPNMHDSPSQDIYLRYVYNFYINFLTRFYELTQSLKQKEVFFSQK